MKLQVGPECGNEMTDIIPVIYFEQNKVDPLDLISRNEETQGNALKEHYEKIEKEKQFRKNEQRLQTCLKFAHVYNPLAALTFVAVYWFLGMRQAEFF